MTDRLLTIIPAKGTSRRVPNKNLADLGGKPLVLWTIEAALGVDAGCSHCVVVSSDSRAILEIANSHGAHPLQRPPELCEDPAQMPDVALHALASCGGFDPTIVCVLLPTSPFRTREHIEEALVLRLSRSRSYNVVSVCEAGCSHKLVQMESHGLLNGPPIRSHMPASYLLNGAIWITTPDRLRSDKHIAAELPYLMDERSGIDIDTPADLEAARAML